MATSDEFTGRVKVPVAGPMGVSEVDLQVAKLQREDAARRAASAAKAKAAQPTTVTDPRGK